VFLLSRALRLQQPISTAQWVDLAQTQSTFMASALNFSAVAESLINGELAKAAERIVLEERLLALSTRADRQTLLCIARVLLERYPPSWILNAVSDGMVSSEYIPSIDLDAMEWIGDELTELLISVAQTEISTHDDALRKRLGNIGELVLMLSKNHQGEMTTHVSKISDHFGYDIESIKKNIIERIEVKAALPHTNSKFYISKNECEKARLYGDEWRLVQLTFDVSVLWKKTIVKRDILCARMLSSSAICCSTDFDTENFRWLSSAEVWPLSSDWIDYPLPLPEDLEISI